jgi:hypothetical protein
MSDPNENVPLGGGQPPLTLAALEAEEKAMQGGKGRMLAAMIVAALLAVGAIVFLLISGGENPYGKFGQNINGIRQAHFDQFWACALRGADLTEVRNNDQLREQINVRATRGRARYGATVRDECLPKLSEVEPKLAALIPPVDVVTQVRDLSDATRRLRSGWSDFIAHLDGLTGDTQYDPEAAQREVAAIEKAWFDYRRVHTKLNDVVREQLAQ